MLAARRFVDGAHAGRQSFENRVQVIEGRCVAANHHAVTAVQPPHAAAGADIDVANAFAFEGLGSAHIVLVIGVAAIDDDVTAVQHFAQGVHCGFGDGACRQHDPDCARRLELLHKRGQILTGRGPFFGQLGHAGGVGVEHHTIVSVAHQSAHNIAAHTAEANHSKLHDVSNK